MGATSPKSELDDEYRKLVSDFLRRLAKQKGWSQAQLGEAMGMSRPSANRYLSGAVQAPLQSLLLLEETTGIKVPREIRAAFTALSGLDPAPEPPPPPQARPKPALKPMPIPGETSSVPVISWVAAGALGDPETQTPAGDETLDISDLGQGEFFATRVRGDSMDRLAPENALLIVNRLDIDLIRGRRYIFSLRGKTTFKRYAEDPVRLDPESLNPAHEPHFIKPTDKWSVVGRVRKVIIDV